jgi:hypothetical protein
MYEPYDDYEDYYGDDYDDSHEYDESQQQSDWNKFYFKFDVSSGPISEWVHKMIDNLINNPPANTNDLSSINNISGFPFVQLPVTDWVSNTVSGGNSLLYLGNNQYNEPIYKYKHFIENKLLNSYTSHIQNHAAYFIKQPSYYKGLFDILN